MSTQMRTHSNITSSAPGRIGEDGSRLACLSALDACFTGLLNNAETVKEATCPGPEYCFN